MSTEQACLGAAIDAPPVVVGGDNLDSIVRSLPLVLRHLCRIAARISVGTLDIVLQDGRTLRFVGDDPTPNATMIIKDLTFVRRLVIGGDLGFAEGYMRNEWDTPDLSNLMMILAANHRSGRRLVPGKPFLRIWQRIRHFLNRNTKNGSRRNIHAHYDIGNAFYEKWLDRSMTYSSAIFEPGDNDLESAQRRKFQRLAEDTNIGPDHHVLEIGCGWGGFAEYAAREIGCRVTGLTISQEQYDFAVKRICDAGLSDRVSIELKDYRDETGTYDRIVSIEMFEAVGEAYWKVFFQQMRDRLVAGGRAGLQLITIRDEAFEGYKREIDFIRRYVFPGGMLPSNGIMTNLSDSFRLPIVSDKGYAADYAQTLALWRDRFIEAWPSIAPLGFDERFRRLWQYYLTYCEVGFATQNVDVRQMVFAKPE
jgi:cyclopropane-fatty-acyl-phospholipid synthase